MKKLYTYIFCSLLLLLNAKTFAQVNYPYIGNFEFTSTVPNAKPYDSDTLIRMSGIQWSMQGVYLGPMNDEDRVSGIRSARIERAASITGEPWAMYMTQNLPTGAGTLSYQAARYGTSAIDTIFTYYSIDEGITWTLHAAEPILDTVLTTYSYTINQAGKVRIKFAKSISSSIINIDNIIIESYCPASNLCLVNKSPQGININTYTDSMILSFNTNIALGTGTIDIYKSDGTLSQSFDIATASTRIEANQLILHGLELENNQTYYVNMEAGTVVDVDDMSITNAALTDTTSWKFRAMDNIHNSYYPDHYKHLDDFYNCYGGTSIGKFTAFSVEGDDVWHCYTDPNEEYKTHAAISGHIADGVSRKNIDYLVFNKKHYIDSVHYHQLMSFFYKTQNNGNCKLHLVRTIDFDFIDPLNFEWDTVRTFFIRGEYTELRDDAQGLGVYYVDGEAYRSYNIGFIYESSDTGTNTLFLRYVNFSSRASIFNPAHYNLEMYVLGMPTSSEIRLQIETPKSEYYTAEIIDLNGRKIHESKFYADAGLNYINLSSLHLTSGMYIIKVYNQDFSNRGSTKAVVR